MRRLLTVALLHFLYQGKDWARIILMFLLGIGAPVAPTQLFALSDTPWAIPFWALIMAYGVAAIVLGASPSVGAFLAAQRRKGR